MSNVNTKESPKLHAQILLPAPCSALFPAACCPVACLLACSPAPPLSASQTRSSLFYKTRNKTKHRQKRLAELPIQRGQQEQAGEQRKQPLVPVHPQAGLSMQSTPPVRPSTFHPFLLPLPSGPPSPAPQPCSQRVLDRDHKSRIVKTGIVACVFGVGDVVKG